MWRSGYLMCPKCFNAYYKDMLKPQRAEKGDWIYECPSACCSGGEMFAIDELMIEPIRQLNTYGYKTKFCCSGHNRDGKYDRDAYVLFAHKHKFDSLPKGWKMDEDGMCIRAKAVDAADICENVMHLIEWANNLPFNFAKKSDSFIA